MSVAGGLDLLVHRVAARRAGSRPARSCCCTAAASTSPTCIPLLDELDPERRLVGATPRGPLTLPPGGYHWYVVERVGFPHRETFMESFGMLTAWLEALRRGDRRARGSGP